MSERNKGGQPPKDTVKLRISVDGPLLEQLRERAAREDVTVGVLVRTALREFLGGNQP